MSLPTRNDYQLFGSKGDRSVRHGACHFRTWLYVTMTTWGGGLKAELLPEPPWQVPGLFQ
jgi:hypothetical protein